MSVSLPWCVPVYGSVVSKKGCDYMRSVRFLALTISIYSSVFVFFHAHVNRALCTTCSSSRLHASIALCPQSRRCGAVRFRQRAASTAWRGRCMALVLVEWRWQVALLRRPTTSWASWSSSGSGRRTWRTRECTNQMHQMLEPIRSKPCDDQSLERSRAGNYMRSFIYFEFYLLLPGTSSAE